MAYLFALLLSLPALALCQPGDINAVATTSFDKLDANGDGNIARPELDAFFKAEDTNNDGRISRHEYTVAVESQYGHDPQVIHALHSLYDALDFNNDNHLDKADYDSLFTKADTSGNNLVNENEFENKMNCLFAILVCLPVFTLCQPNWVAVELALFRHFDSNADGHLTRVEVSSYLNTFDTDGDGQVSRQEYNAHINAQYSHDPTTQRELHALFDDLDTNNNNNLSTADYTALFDDADANANNQVSALEFNRWFHQAVGSGFIG
ncbi:unnamed protein product [Lymnaea stagnalis]|uniref:EF-hand domain-containing protein n=1 Tax=Lymnaea stagnalis TaxID=6523 RepID=A0AAV2I500_LYMST